MRSRERERRPTKARLQPTRWGIEQDEMASASFRERKIARAAGETRERPNMRWRREN